MSDMFAKPQPAELYFTVPGEVRGKGRPRTRVVTAEHEKSFAHVYTDAKTKNYEARIATYAMQAKGRAGWAMVMDEPLRLDVAAWIAIPKSWSKKKRAALDGQFSTSRIDGDNILKSCLDACHNVIYQDDKVVAMMTCTKRWIADPKLERLVIRVSRCV